MTCQNLTFQRPHKEGQSFSYASYVFKFQLTTRFVPILIGHVTARRISLGLFTTVWSN